MGIPMTNEDDLIMPTMDDDGNLFVDGKRLYRLSEAARLRNVTYAWLDHHVRFTGDPIAYQMANGFRYVTIEDLDDFIARRLTLRVIEMTPLAIRNRSKAIDADQDPEGA